MGRFFINWRLWLAGIALVALGWGLIALEKHGYNRAKDEQVKADLEASERIRVLEAQLQTKVTQVEIRYVERKKTASKEAEKTATAVDDFTATVDSLPNCPSSPTPESPSTPDRIDEPTINGILKECAATLAGMAEIADQLSNQVTGLQDYINSVAP
jgi:ATP-dependent Lon protease